MAQRAAQDRKPKRTTSKAKPRRDGLLGTSAGGTLDRNRSGLAGRRGGAVLEDSATGRPSRKSTRASSDHTKRTTNQQLRAVARTTAPSSRARARAR